MENCLWWFSSAEQVGIAFTDFPHNFRWIGAFLSPIVLRLLVGALGHPMGHWWIPLSQDLLTDLDGEFEHILIVGKSIFGSDQCYVLTKRLLSTCAGPACLEVKSSRKTLTDWSVRKTWNR
jgi:hypothetical protein